MKKLELFCIIAFCALFICLFTYNSKAAFSIGDVNGDGKISANDYIMVKKHILGLGSLTQDNKSRADLNFDNNITAQDYIMIKKILLNIITSPTYTPVPVTSTPKPTSTPVPTATPTPKPTFTPTPTAVPKGPTKIHFLNSGGSNAFLLESDGHYALIDASNPYKSGTKWDEGHDTSVGKVKSYLKSIGVSKLDVVIATHSHSDHIGGMAEITDYVNSNTKYYYRTYVETTDDHWYPDWDNSGFYSRSVTAMQNAGAQLVEVTGKKPSFTLGDLKIDILNTDTPRDSECYTIDGKKLAWGENKNSLVVYVRYGDFETVIAGDMEKEDEMDIANLIGKIEVLQMGHHGAITSSTQGYIQKFKPDYLIIPTDKYKLTNEVLRFSSIRLAQRYGAKVYVTTKAQDAVVFECSNGDCKVTSNEALINMTIEQKDNSPWEKITYGGESIWMYYQGGIYMENGWVEDGGKYYHFAPGGQMQVGWQEVTWSKGTNWFYFNVPDGEMLTGWQKIKWSGGTNWFYFDPTDGYMYANTTKTIDGKSYTFNSSGVCTSSGC